MPAKTGKTGQVVKTMDRIDAILVQVQNEILKDLGRVGGPERYTDADLHKSINDIYKLSISKQILAQSH